MVERRRGRSEVQFVVVAERCGAMAGFEVRFWQGVILAMVWQAPAQSMLVLLR